MRRVVLAGHVKYNNGWLFYVSFLCSSLIYLSMLLLPWAMDGGVVRRLLGNALSNTVGRLTKADIYATLEVRMRVTNCFVAA